MALYCFNLSSVLFEQIRACLTRSSRESRRHTLGGSCQSNSVLTFHHRFSPLGLALPSKPVALSELQRTRGRVFGSPDSLSQVPDCDYRTFFIFILTAEHLCFMNLILNIQSICNCYLPTVVNTYFVDMESI